jgi:Inner membrane component of T3SS, cytoplasmic domain/BON domain
VSISPTAADRFAGLLELAAPVLRRRSAVPAEPPRFEPAARLLVRDGLHSGAWMSLHGQRLRVGSADDGDIALTDPGMPPLAAQFVRGDEGWQLEVPPGGGREGSNDTPTAAAEPVAGESRNGRWRRRRWQLHGVTMVVIDASPFAAAAPPPAPRRHLVLKIALGAGATLLAIFAVVAFAEMAKPSSHALVAQALPALQALKLPDVRLRRADDGTLELTGQVNDAAEFAKLRDWLYGSPVDDAHLRVQVGTALADQVRQALGSAPETKVTYTGGGHVRVEGSTRSADLKRQVQTLAAEMHGTVAIDDQLALIDGKDAAPAQRPLPIRIVNVMLGDAPYFQTDAGSTYFVGSVLPDGAEVIAIAPLEILFRLGDRDITYRLDH